MDNTNEKNLKAFYEKLLELKNKEEQKSLSQQELKDIAFELGFSENEWHLVEAKVEGHLKNGQSFLGFQNWNDAIEEFEQALHLSPNNPAATYGLAIAYSSMYNEGNKKAHKEKALQYARIRLVNEPGHEPSIRIISELQKTPQTSSFTPPTHQPKASSSPVSQKSKIPLVAGIAVFVLFIAGAISFFTVKQGIPDQESHHSFEKTIETDPPNHNNQTVMVAPTDRDRSEIPTKFVSSPAGQGIKLWSIDRSKSSPSRTRFYYKLAGSLKVESNQAIEELKLKVEFITHEGRVAMAEYVEALRRYNPTAIKGDYIPFYFSKSKKGYTSEDFKEIRLSVHTIKRSQTSQRLTNKPVPTTWAYDPPQGIKIDVRERKQTVRGYSKSISHKVELNFINKSRVPIKRLKIEAQWLNHNNEIVHSVIRTLVYPHQALWRPNHNRLHNFNAYIKNLTTRQIKGYRINVIEVEVK